MKMNGQPIKNIVTALFENFAEDKAITYVEERLEDRYEDFKNLLREYEEGILLFEITKDEVWDKASQDTVGLKNYYNQHKNKYVWEPRAVVTNYTLRTAIEGLVNDIISTAKNSSPEEVVAKYNLEDKELVIYESATLERSSEAVRGLAFTVGTISTPKINNGLKVTTFNKIEETIPASKKSLKESKGYVISDYQDELERTWITSLKNKYKVDINKKVFKSLIAK
jgi:peptidyl-prolyl cis-trans isomerase SurA